MTDEQWLWLFANEALDTDEQLEHMCPKCQHDVSSDDKCIRCGKPLGNSKYKPEFVNPNFDEKKFEAISNGTYDSDIDYDLVNQILGDRE